jgi:hypothetical protein
VLEVARVMAEMDYHPETTIEFSLFAAEEMGVFGSMYDAQKAKAQGKDIRFMYNMDMIANNPNNGHDLTGANFSGNEWTAYTAAAATERYTDLKVTIYPHSLSPSTDSYSYWHEGFPVYACQEWDLSPFVFTAGDTVGNCDVDYLSKVAGGALATFVEQQLFPTPQNVTASSGKTEILIKWKPTNNAIVKGVDIYRSDTTGIRYQKITQQPLIDTVYHDLNIESNKQYYYVLSTVNDSLQTGEFSDEVSGAKFNFSDTLLVLNNMKASQICPDSVFAFYQAILDTIPFVWQDLNANQKITTGMLSRYRSILWVSNSENFETADAKTLQNVSDFISNGGNILFAGFNPRKFWVGGTTYPLKSPESSVFRQVFKVDSIDRKIQCTMFRANAAGAGYDTLKIDSLKHVDPGLPGEIYNVEVFTPSPQGHVIYRLDTKYDSTSVYGKMKHRPVGLEYMGDDFKSILLSFPLYYLDAGDARNFVHYVMKEKFVHSVGIEQNNRTDICSVDVYPNPLDDVCHITFDNPEAGRVKAILISSQGKPVRTLIEKHLDKGRHSISFSTGGLPPGLYQIVLRSITGFALKKIIILH